MTPAERFPVLLDQLSVWLVAASNGHLDEAMSRCPEVFDALVSMTGVLGLDPGWSAEDVLRRAAQMKAAASWRPEGDTDD